MLSFHPTRKDPGASRLPGVNPTPTPSAGADNRRVEWLEYPGGMRLASPPHRGKRACTGCGARTGDRHETTCQYLVCPNCNGFYAECDCTDPLIVESRYFSLEVAELLGVIDALASKYQGYQVLLSRLQVHPVNMDVLRRKAQALEKAVAMKEAADKILDRYPPSVLVRWRNSGELPRYLEQAYIMSRVAHRLWLDWAYR